MSTGIQISSGSSGITVGTTAVTSGTDGRVFFQAGGVVQQDAGFLWDTTNKRMQLLGTGVIASPALNSVLEIKAKNASDIVFRVRNSADTRNFLTVNGAGDVFNNGAQGVTSNTFYGENSGRSSTGLYNCFFGLTAGRDNSTGANNCFFGVEAGRINTSGGSNSFFGIQAGTFNTTGGNNSFFGGSAGYSNGGGGYNSFFGGSAGSGNTSGSYNSCFGFAAGEFNSTGSENVFIGDETGRRTSSNANVTVANNSIFIGVLARANANSETNQIVIGHSATGLGSNTTVIGNSSTTLFRPYGNVAIGANSASARLDVRAQGALSTDIAFRVRNSADTLNTFQLTGDGKTRMQGSVYYTEFDPANGLYVGSNFGNHINLSGVLQGTSWFNAGADGKLAVGRTGANYRFHVNSSTTNSNIPACFNNENNDVNGQNGIAFTTTWTGSAFGNIGGVLNMKHTHLGGNGALQNCQFDFNLNYNNSAPTTRASITGRSNILIGTPTENTADSHTIYIPNGTAPTTSVTDGYKQYSADITAGNAAPHFRTENGDIIKLYKETTAVGAATLVGGGGTTLTDTDTFDGYTLKQVVKALRNLGILA